MILRTYITRVSFRRNDEGDFHPDRQLNDHIKSENLDVISVQETRHEYAVPGNSSTNTVFVEYLITYTSRF